MINERLLDFEYYKKKLPLYMLNSEGIVEQFEIIFDLLKELNVSQDDVIKGINVFDALYLEYINSLEDANSGLVSDILDKIGALFSVSRNFNLTYIDNGISTTSELSLNNELFLTLIKARIIQNCFDGSREMANEFYKSANLPIYMFTNASSPASCDVILNSSEIDVSSDLRALFLSGLLTITSLGIHYTYSIDEISSLLIWDVFNWNEGRWS